MWYYVWLGWTVEAFFLYRQPSIFDMQSPSARSIDKDLLVLNKKNPHIYIYIYVCVTCHTCSYLFLCHTYETYAYECLVEVRKFLLSIFSIHVAIFRKVFPSHFPLPGYSESHLRRIWQCTLFSQNCVRFTCIKCSHWELDGWKDGWMDWRIGGQTDWLVEPSILNFNIKRMVPVSAGVSDSAQPFSLNNKKK